MHAALCTQTSTVADPGGSLGYDEPPRASRHCIKYRFAFYQSTSLQLMRRPQNLLPGLCLWTALETSIVPTQTHEKLPFPNTGSAPVVLCPALRLSTI